MLFILATITLPSYDEKTFFIFGTVSFLATAAIEGPLPEIEAPRAPFSINLEIISVFEFRIEDVANPFYVIAFQ